MAIKVKCPDVSCGVILTLNDANLGKTVKCPVCGQPVPISASTVIKEPKRASPPPRMRSQKDAETSPKTPGPLETEPKDEKATAKTPGPKELCSDPDSAGYQLAETEDELPPAIPGSTPGPGIKEKSTPPIPQKRQKGKTRSSQGGTIHSAEADGLAKVARGLGFHSARIQLTLWSLFVPCLSGVLVETIGRNSPQVALLATVLVLGFAVAPPVLGLVGSVLCLSVPPASRARGYITSSLVLEFAWPLVLFVAVLLVGVSLSALAAVFHAAHLPTSVFVGIVVLAIESLGLVALLPWIFFLLFLGRVAAYLDKPELARESVSMPVVVVRWWLLFGLGFGLCLGITAAMEENLEGFHCPIIGLFLVAVFLAFKLAFAYLELIRSFRQVIQERLGIQATR